MPVIVKYILVFFISMVPIIELRGALPIGVGMGLSKAGKKLTKSANNYGPFIALMLFVGIPLPGTGAWTGTLAASMLDLDKKKSSVAVMIGVVMAGLIMLLISYLGSIGINSIGDLFNSLFH